MTQSTRIYRHSAAGTDWAALLLGAGLGLTLALQATTLRSGDFKDFYSVVVTLSRLAALVGAYSRSIKWIDCNWCKVGNGRWC
jgi:hypothetical protein